MLISGQAFQLRRTGNFDLSYESLTSYKARGMLCKLRTTDPAFWDELIKKAPSDSVLPPLAGAELESDDYIYPPFKDNSDLSCDIIIAKVFGFEIDRVEATIDSDLVSTAMVESLDNEPKLVDGNTINNASDDQLGHGKSK